LRRHAHGFSLVELITVMVLIGALAAVAVPRLMGNTWASTTYRQEVISALRHAQKSAVSHRRLVCANVAGNTVTLTIATANPGACNPPYASPYASPDGTPYQGSDPNVVAGGIAGNLLFQPDGRITRIQNGVEVLAAGNITIQGEADIVIQGATGHVE
jgi:MSHA pilin protein MshC